MPLPIALQLYSIRDELSKNFEDGVRRVAAMGYAGVEPAGFPGTTAEAAGALFRELGLKVPSAHMGLPVGDAKAQVIADMRAIGSTRIVSGLGPDNFKTADDIKQAAERFNEAGRGAATEGMTFGIHNHWWEFEQVDGRLACEVLLDHLAPEVFLEVDTYWVKVGGADPAAVLRQVGARAPLLHIKDGPGVKGEDHMAVGDGIMDFPAVFEAGKDHAEWAIVELDSCATDMMEAVQKSYTYLTGQGLAQGKS